MPLPPRPCPWSSASPAPRRWCLPTKHSGFAYYAPGLSVSRLRERGREQTHAKTRRTQSTRNASAAHTLCGRACVHNIEKLKHTAPSRSPLISRYIPFPHYALCEHRLCKDNTHIPTHKEFPPAGSDSRQLCNKTRRCAKSPNIYRTLILKNPWICAGTVLCVAKYQKGAGYFGYSVMCGGG